MFGPLLDEFLKHGGDTAGTPDLEGGADGGGDGGDGTAVAAGSSIPLLPIEVYARNHALLCSIGFLILLPIGTLVARYARTFTRRWFWAHSAIQLVISAPVIFTGWAMGHTLCNRLELKHFSDPHQKMALALLILYCLQLSLGLFIHFVKIPTLGAGRRSMQNYFHAVLGLAIIALASEQVHYGLTVEWLFALGGVHQVPESAMHAWTALVVIFWVLYFLGLALLHRQYKQESQSRRENLRKVEQSGSEDQALARPSQPA